MKHILYCIPVNNNYCLPPLNTTTTYNHYFEARLTTPRAGLPGTWRLDGNQSKIIRFMAKIHRKTMQKTHGKWENHRKTGKS